MSILTVVGSLVFFKSGSLATTVLCFSLFDFITLSLFYKGGVNTGCYSLAEENNSLFDFTITTFV